MNEIKIDEQNSTIYFPTQFLYCRLFIFNYFFKNYGIEDVKLNVNYFKLDGEFLNGEIIEFRDDESIIIDSKNSIYSEDIYIELSIVDCPDYIQGIVRALPDYYTPSGVITSVHEQGAFWGSANDVVVQGNMNLICNQEITTYAIIQNTHIEQKEIDVKLIAYKRNGESLEILRDHLKYREMKLIDLDIDRKVTNFLNGEEGHFTVQYSNYIGRVAYIHLSRDIKNLNYASISHGTYYADNKIRPHTQNDYYTDKNSEGLLIQSVLLYQYDGFSSKFSFFNDYDELKHYDLNIYDNNGILIKSIKKLISLKTNEMATIDSSILSKYLQEDFKGLAKFIIYFEDGRFPMYENSGYEIVYNQFSANSAIGGFPKINDLIGFDDFVTSKITNSSRRSGSMQRSRQFCRAYNKKYDSFLVVSFTTSSLIEIKKDIEANIKIIFTSLSGNYSIRKYLPLKLNCVIFENINNILSLNEQELLGDVFSIYLREPNYKVLSLVLLQDKVSKDIGMDHFVGG